MVVYMKKGCISVKQMKIYAVLPLGGLFLGLNSSISSPTSEQFCKTGWVGGGLLLVNQVVNRP